MNRILFKGREIRIGVYQGKRESYVLKKEPTKTSVQFDGRQALFYTHRGQSTIVQAEDGITTRRFPGGGIVSFTQLATASKWQEPIYEMGAKANLWATLNEIMAINDFDVIEGDREQIRQFLKAIKPKEQLDREAACLKQLTGNVNVMPPDLSRYGLDVIVISTSYGCGNTCNGCIFGPYTFRPVDEDIVDRQIDYYRRNFPKELLQEGVIVLGNQRAGKLGEKLAYYRDKICQAYDRGGPLLAFGNIEDAIDIEGLIMNVGIESGSAEVRRQFGKNYSNEYIISSCLKMKTFSANFLTGDDRHIEATRNLLVDMVRAGVNPENVFIYVSSLSQEPGWPFGEPAVKLRDAIRSAGFSVSPYGFFAYTG